MIDLEKMAEAHKKLFPNATAGNQLWKLEEEIEEWHNADTEHEIEELADIFIVCGGLYRWYPLTATSVANCFRIINRSKICDDDIETIINRKWQINLKRKWEWNGKTYHHIEEK